MTVYPLTAWQIGSLKSYFDVASAPEPHNITIQSLAFTDNQDIIISYVQYGENKTQLIPKEPNSTKQ